MYVDIIAYRFYTDVMLSTIFKLLPQIASPVNVV